MVALKTSAHGHRGERNEEHRHRRRGMEQVMYRASITAGCHSYLERWTLRSQQCAIRPVTFGLSPPRMCDVSNRRDQIAGGGHPQRIVVTPCAAFVLQPRIDGRVSRDACDVDVAAGDDADVGDACARGSCMRRSRARRHRADPRLRTRAVRAAVALRELVARVYENRRAARLAPHRAAARSSSAIGRGGHQATGADRTIGGDHQDR